MTVADSKDLRILMVHNFYQYPGGEDQVFVAETDLLRQNGHHVETYTLHNRQIDAMSKLSLASATLWSRQSYAEIQRAAADMQADIVHFHNTLPLVSPSGYYASHRAGASVVQTLHNYRLACAGALFLRNGQVCEDCLGKRLPWPAIRHRCYRQDRAASATIAVMLAGHQALGTWQRAVDRYITLTEFSRGKMLDAGLPAEKVSVKPNFVDPDPGEGAGQGGYALFVGRLSSEKGIDTLIRAWSHHCPTVPLRIAGDGPMAGEVRDLASRLEMVQWLGPLRRDRLTALYKDASMLIVPSHCFEGFPMVIAEGFATGLPVIASDLGSLPSIVEDQVTGLLFPPRDAAALGAAVTGLHADGERLGRMRRQARRRYERHFTARAAYRNLIDIYREARQARIPQPRAKHKLASTPSARST